MGGALPPFEFLAQSTPLLAAALLLQLLLAGMMFQRGESLKRKFGVGDVPDARFGCSPDDLYLYDYLAALGPDGREAYRAINSLDLFLYIPCYTMLFGSLLVRQCRTAGVSTKLSWIFPLTTMFDVVESSIFGYSARRYPVRLDPSLLMLASLSNQLKWVMLLLGLTALGVLFIRNLLLGVKAHRS